MRVKLDEGAGEEAQVQMAPLIDCVFLLLVFFIVTASVQKVHKEIALDLPEFGASEQARDPDPTVVIGVDQQGAIYVEDQQVSRMALHKILREAYARNPNTKVRIDGDRRAAFQYIAYVLDICQFENLKDIGLKAKTQR